MNHDRFEELLPAYLDGDLSAADRAELESALEASAELRDALEQYRTLEQTLVMRRDEVPAADGFLGWMESAPAESAPADSTLAGSAPARADRLRRWMDAILSVPSLAVMACIALATWTYWHVDAIAAFFTRAGQTTSGLDALGRSLNTVMMQYTGGDMTTLIAAYVAVTLLIVAATGMMTMRFVRSS